MDSRRLCILPTRQPFGSPRPILFLNFSHSVCDTLLKTSAYYVALPARRLRSGTKQKTWLQITQKEQSRERMVARTVMYPSAPTLHPTDMIRFLFSTAKKRRFNHACIVRTCNMQNNIRFRLRRVCLATEILFYLMRKQSDSRVFFWVFVCEVKTCVEANNFLFLESFLKKPRFFVFFISVVDNLSAEGGNFLKFLRFFYILPFFPLFAAFPTGIVDNSARKSVSCETFRCRYPQQSRFFNK